LTKAMVTQLWDHWSERAKANKPILVFTSAKEQDFSSQLGSLIGRAKPQLVRKRTLPHLDVSDDEPSGDKPSGHTGKGKDRAEEGEGTSGSHLEPPQSKRRRLSEQPTVPEENSPAANNSNRAEFLNSLSSDSFYKNLLNDVSAWPAVVSSFFLLLYGFV
jgi:hypothetical protein